jgi:preprotein translocase subunit YajC
LFGSFGYMNLMGVNTVLAFSLAPSQSGTQQDPRAQTLQMVGTLVLMIVLFYFVMMRPQQKRQKEQAAMLKSVQKGDKILTNGGIIGEVITVKQESLMVRSADSKFEIAKNAVAQITEKTGAAAGGS